MQAWLAPPLGYAAHTKLWEPESMVRLEVSPGGARGFIVEPVALV